MNMASTSKPTLKRKRRPADECPNPLFVKWIEEWRDEAREEGSKVQYAYAKALNSLKKYPLPLQSGQEAKILDNIGDKLAKKLDKKLARYRAENGETDENTVGVRERRSGHGEISSSPVKAKKKRNQAADYVPEYRSGPYALIIALHQAKQKPCWMGYVSKKQLMTLAQPFCDKSFTIPDDGKYYTAWSSMSMLIRKGLVDKRSCPAKFSLTAAGEEMAEKLERATSNLASSSSLSPTTVTHTTSSYSDPCTQPTIPTKPGAHSSSPHYQVDCPRPCKTSRVANAPTSRNIILKSISPPLITSHPLSPLNSPPPLPPPSTVAIRSGVPEAPMISLVSDSDDDIEILPPLANRIQKKSTTPPHHLPCVMGCENVCVMETPLPVSNNSDSRKGRASGGDGRRGRGGGGGLTPSQMAGQAALLRLEKGMKRCEEGGEVGGGNRRKIGCKGRKGKGKELTCTVDLTEEGVSVTKKLIERFDAEEEFPDYLPLTKRKLKDKTTHTSRVISPPLKSLPAQTQHSPNLSPCSPVSLPLNSPPVLSHHSPQLSPSSPISLSPSNRHTLGNIASSTGHISNKPPPQSPPGSPLFILRPGDYEVVLCVDSAESTASQKSSSQFRGILLQELAKNGVKFDVRKLSVGDFLWIAQEKAAPLPGQLTLPKSREIVLEYIVERKRMDDLAQSITDGRFKEQKFRIKQCGVKQPIYLVEEFSDKMHLKLPTRSLEQAISNTQVDGFIVHRTTDVRESVAYLTLLTRQLSQQYSGKVVEAYGCDSMAEFNKVQSLQHIASPGLRQSIHGVEFQSFNEASVKNKSLTASEMFGRHLMQCPAVSAERAALILEHFPTITALRDAYRKCPTDGQRESLISSLKTDQMSRSLGKAVGKLVCKLYWGH